jgi:1,4-alpha-glucan branching enzyme
MKKILQTIIIFLSLMKMGFGKESINPSISPALFTYDTEITVTYDVTGTSMASLTKAYLWVWMPGKNIDAKYNVNPATAAADQAKFIKTVVDGKTLFTITFIPSSFFIQDITAEKHIGMLLKGTDWANGQTTDFIADFWDGSFQIKLNSPAKKPLFVSNGEEIIVRAETPVNASYELFVNDVSVNVQQNVRDYTYSVLVSETSGYGMIRLKATTDSGEDEISFQYLLSGNSPVAARPAGVIDGINYSEDATSVILSFWAPDKNSVYVLGDFTNWNVLPEYLMKKDGEHFWIEISGITPQQEYAFQYLVDESVYIADPYADKILDPDDQYIPESVYPDLKNFPAAALKNDWYFNRLSVFQTGQISYQWQVENFQKPDKEKLVIYELLIRDFFANGERSYRNLTDTIAYFARLGVNAIELMPIMEFNGNESWGYNPAFMFAPDKYYGPKNALKTFVDECHKQGISVILDIALNHQDIPNSYLMLDFDFAAFKPEPDNKWFNVTATHPFSVFYDMNHESAYTKKFIDTVNFYWLNEYKVDGFRFDLSKGFTQTNNPDNVGAWSAYDASRIAILKRMADRIWSHTPAAYVILEHLSENTEEKELAEYRAEEGKGMMLWGKMTDAYNQNTMGYAENSAITGIYYGTRGWQYPRLVGYMESHDEERLMFKNLAFGNTSANYTVKDTTTALNRMRAAAALFYTVPGPKMLWQFGELGYDYSINHCEDGSNKSDCRVSPKPVRWDYHQEERRSRLYNHISELIGLRKQYPVFTKGTAAFSADNSLVKQIMLKNDPFNEHPSSIDQMNAVVVGNFDLVSRDANISFPHGGAWYDFYENGNAVEVTGTALTITLNPGGYRIFTDVAIQPSVITSAEASLVDEQFSVYPNPVTSSFSLNFKYPVEKIVMHSSQGIAFYPKQIDKLTWDVNDVPPGLYILEAVTRHGSKRTKIIKR